MLVSGGQVAPLTLGDEVPSLAFGTYYPSAGLGLADAFATYAQVYKSQVWIATLVNKIAFGLARLPCKVYRREDDGSRTEQRDSPYAQLLRSPNSRHDPFFFWLWTVSTFEIYGEALWVKARPGPGRPPQALYPMHPANTYTRRADKAETLGNGTLVQPGELVYRFQLGSAAGTLMEWSERDIVHFRSYNPHDQVRGLSRLEPLRQTILNEDAARKAAGAFWKNGGRPSVVLEHPTTLSQPAQDRLRAQSDAMHAGVSNWGKSMLLEEGMKATFVPLNAEEMQYIESRKVNREEACGMYDVPPPVVHILDKATFSNITEQMRSMYRDTMAPRVGLFESVLDSQLRPDFDPQGNLYAEFLMDQVLRGSFEQRVQAYEVMSRIAGFMPAEIRQMENLPDAGPETHRLYVNAATIPLGEVTRRAQMVQEGAEIVPTSADDQQPAPQPKAIDGELVCATCGSEGKTSARGLCRSCEGKYSRMLEKGQP